MQCDSWTTFEVTDNRLKIVAGEGVTDEDGISLRNVRFSVPSGVLRIDPKVSFYRNSGEDEVRVPRPGRARLRRDTWARVSSPPPNWHELWIWTVDWIAGF